VAGLSQSTGSPLQGIPRGMGIKFSRSELEFQISQVTALLSDVPPKFHLAAGYDLPIEPRFAGHVPGDRQRSVRDLPQQCRTYLRLGPVAANAP